jgi:hypothetical protein
MTETTTETRHTEITRFWRHIFGELDGYFLCTFTGKQVWSGSNELVGIVHEWWRYPQEADDAAGYVLEEAARGRDAYHATHLYAERGTRRGGRTKANAAPEVISLWVDGDGATVPDNFPVPTAIIESSPGRHHYYWRLDAPVAPERAEELNKRLTYGMGGDRGKWGLGTVLRAPGTRNYKRETPSLVEVVTCG